ncbi:Predicted tRNA synthetases class II (D, K and N) [gamma proteobacterium HdN1]|nr:Predicted tRNA synthetases class II (D, K and N) [gamma proteobacterium HdN1]
MPDDVDSRGWRPSASLDALRARAHLNQRIRDFFSERGVLEVETPLLCSSTATDPFLTSLSLQWRGCTRYLQTSPEFPMKRLLAAGSGPIFQLCKVFRADEFGRLHNPEFSMLEWYRPGFSLADLMDETEALIVALAAVFGRPLSGPFQRVSYRKAFLDAVGVDPLTVSDLQLSVIARECVPSAPEEWDRDGWLNLLMAEVVEPHLGNGPVFVWGFPPSQASLARCLHDDDGERVAARAEFYLGGMELANGYDELTDAQEQRVRFQADLAQRQCLDAASVPMPDALLDALQAGLPPSAGMALGVDRLLMWLLDKPRIADVCSFTADRA